MKTFINWLKSFIWDSPETLAKKQRFDKFLADMREQYDLISMHNLIPRYYWISDKTQSTSLKIFELCMRLDIMSSLIQRYLNTLKPRTFIIQDGISYRIRNKERIMNQSGCKTNRLVRLKISKKELFEKWSSALISLEHQVDLVLQKNPETSLDELQDILKDTSSDLDALLNYERDLQIKE